MAAREQHQHRALDARRARARRSRSARPGLHASALLQQELDEALARAGEDSEEVRDLREEIAALRARIERIPFIDRFDLRYNNRVKEPRSPPPRR
jgi:uncharacterized sporulation protein YeaH/YhbH (DUF444 family)